MIRQLKCTTEWHLSDIKDLESAAWEVLRSASNTSVIAGPGAGKTELLAQRACYLLENGATRFPRRILAISFKRDAAKNLRDRVSARCAPEDAVRFDSYTFDGFAKRLLDRFRLGLTENWRPTADYEILFPKYDTFTNFLIGLSQSSSSGRKSSEIRAINSNTFAKNTVLGLPIPENGIAPKSVEEWAASEWWRQSLWGNTRSRLTFPMIGRLVELIIRLNPQVRQALLATYSHVFLDEFQDTTHVQYDLVKTMFCKSASVLTAVGDNKQQIMRWAMALDDAFGMFEQDFGAKRISLVRNYRSSPDLVDIQHRIALAVDPNATHAESQVQGEFPQDACKIIEFATPEDEGTYLKELISSECSSGELTPRDYVILVKQKPFIYLEELAPVLDDSDVNVRDEGDLQDILADQLVRTLMSFLRFGSSRRSPQHWMECIRATEMLWGLGPDDISDGRSMQEALGAIHVKLRELMGELPASFDELTVIVDTVLSFLGEDNIKLIYPEYSQGNWYRQVLDRLIDHLFQSCESSDDWQSALDDFEGTNSVPLMTIHKSKGLEYHTVIFLALDDSAWWSFSRQPEEARSTFFVAFSRAKQRVIFTYCPQRGRKTQIDSLYELLQQSGVRTYT